MAEQSGTRCAEFGLRFPDRILAGFHTALNGRSGRHWRRLLSGVSGTGKSELPKLYSHFGGMVFNIISVPAQLGLAGVDARLLQLD